MQAQQKSRFVSSTIFPPSLSTISAHEEKGPVIHPCKIYNALAVGAPILYIGPEPSHLSEILAALGSRVCARLRHGDVDGCATQISRIAGEQQRGEPECYEAVTAQFSQRVLLGGIVAELECGPNA
jgi:hypothetical protein